MSHHLPTTRFIFVRHAQTQWNNEHRYAGDSEVPLAEQSAEQIETLTRYLKDEEIDVIYSSPLSRCINTITPTATAHGLRIIIRNELKERHLGDWEGKLASEIHLTHTGYHFPTSAYNGDFRVPNAEPLEDVQHRLRNLLHELHESHPGQTVALATHAGLIWALDAHIVQNTPKKLIWATNCSITTVISEDRHFIELATTELHEMTPENK